MFNPDLWNSGFGEDRYGSWSEVICIRHEMETGQETATAVLRQIYALLFKIHAQQQQCRLPLEHRKIWTKQDVLDKLNMSESTYRRNIKIGLLNPMRLNGIDTYFEEDLLRAMEESRRKGRF